MGDNGFWEPRESFLVPIPELAKAADLLSQAADQMVAGNADQARELLRQADMPILRAYTASAMSSVTEGVHRWRAVENLPREIPKSERGKRAPSPAEEVAIITRDGFRCRYCGCRVVFRKAQTALSRALPGAVHWGNRDIELNAAFYTLKAVLDHVVPHAHGGGSDADNLVTSCQPCNYGKGNWFIEQVGLKDPRLRPPIVDSWDGLTRLINPEISKMSAAAKKIRDHGVPKKPPAPRKTRTAKSPPSIDDWLAGVTDGDRPDFKRLLQTLDGCADLGVSYSVREILAVKFTQGHTYLTVFGILRDGEVQTPWDIGDYKGEFRSFTELLAASIPGAEPYPTEKMWRIRKDGRQLHIGELVKAGDGIRQAFEALYRSLRQLSG